MPDKEREEPQGTTLSVEEWIEEMNRYDSLSRYAKKRQEERGEEKREEPEEKQEEPREGTLTEEEWIELMNKHDRLSQYAKQRRERREQEKDDE
jgi:hypothetical protein